MKKCNIGCVKHYIAAINYPSEKVTLGVGVCFGEIALLGTGGMNRRTANVR